MQLIDYDSEIQDISKSLTEVKLRLSSLVTRWVLDEVVKELISLPATPQL